jgi:FtsH-binding integral membrane protein
MKKLYNSFLQKIKSKKIFLMKVFGMLIFQIFLAFLSLKGFEHSHITHNKIYLIGAFILLFGIIIFIHFIKNIFIKFLTFCFFSVTIGFLLSYQFFTKGHRKHKKETEEEYEQRKNHYAEIENKSLLTTIGIFVFMVLFGAALSYFQVYIPYQFGIGLFFTLLVMILIIFIVSLSGMYSMFYKLISAVIIFIFTLFIIYDTYNILERDYYDDYVSASLDYFLDFINIFSNTLNLQ